VLEGPNKPKKTQEGMAGRRRATRVG